MRDPFSVGHYLLRPYLITPLLIVILLSGMALKPTRTLSVEMLQFRSEITDYAHEFIGIKYQYAGSTPETGFDCSGLVSYVLKKFDATIARSSALQSRQGTQISLSEVLPGDLLFFGKYGRVKHVALVVERTANGIVCIHSTRRGVVLESANSLSYWRSRILFARDILGQRKW